MNTYTLTGTLIADSLVISLSEPVNFANNSLFNIDVTVVGLSPATYLLLYTDSLAAVLDAYSCRRVAPLFATLATVSTVGSTSSVVLGNATELSTVNVQYLFEATRLDDYTAAVVFIDADTGFGLSCQLISITAEYEVPDSVLIQYSYFKSDDGDNPSLQYVVQLGAKLAVTTVC